MGRPFLIPILLLATALAAPALGDDAPKPPKAPLETARSNARGVKLLREGKYSEAVDALQPEALKRPENAILQRNLAGALTRSQQMEEGLAAYSQALRFAEGPQEKAAVLYDLGNALTLAGQLQPAMETYAQAMFLAPDDLDIKHNFEFVMRQMQEQQQQQQEQQQQDEGEKNPEQQEQGEDQQQSQEQQQQQEQQSEEQQSQAQPQPQEQEQGEQDRAQAEPEDSEAMNPEDAQRLLDAMLEEEKELQAERNRQQQFQHKNVEKDW